MQIFGIQPQAKEAGECYFEEPEEIEAYRCRWKMLSVELFL